MNSKAKITKRFVDSINVEKGKRTVVFDTELIGFCLRVSSQNKIYYAIKWMNNKAVWVKIGLHGVITPDQARTIAKEKLFEMGKGINPNTFKTLEQVRENITLEYAMDKFFTLKKDVLRESTKKNI